jgi:hypothetical protein
MPQSGVWDEPFSWRAPYGDDSLTVGGIRFDKAVVQAHLNRLPAENFLLGDSMPKRDCYWSSSCWWPGPAWIQEHSSLEDSRASIRTGTAPMGLPFSAMEHAEARKDKQINPIRPGFGDAKGLINSRYWDPYKRSNL